MAAGAGPDQVRYYGSRRAGTSGYQRGVHKGARKASRDRPPAPPENPYSRGAAGDRCPGCRTGGSCPGTSRGHQRRGSHGARKSTREKKERKAHAAAKLQAPPEEPALSPPGAPVLPPVAPGPAPKTGRKGKKEDAIKRFVSTRIVRETEESPDAIIAKDELYQLFERWCRDHDYAAIPDRRVFFVALKNKYALAERSVAGVPSWISIRIK